MVKVLIWSNICMCFPVHTTPLRSNKTQILLVEDNPADARLIEIYLQESGFGYWEVQRAETLNQALEKLTSQEYAIVLLDLSLPDGMGIANIRQIKQRFPEQNIVVLTGFDERVYGLEAVREGAQDFLVKGDYDESSLAKTLRFLIERQDFIRRLEETQKIARIGSWEYHPASGELVLSDQLLVLTGSEMDGVNEGRPGPEFRRLLDRIHRIAMSGREVNLDTRIRVHNNGERYFHVQCRLTRNSGNVEILQGILQDVTERYVTEEMRKSRDLARQSTKIREQFIASVSHEMRTPINAIMGLSHLLMADDLPPEKKQMVESIKGASDILLGIVNDILDLSAIQSGNIQFRIEPFSLREMCHNLERILSGKMNDKHLGWKMCIEEQIPDYLQGDKLRFSQILFNLLGNAIKFTHQGQIGMYIELIDRNKEQVRLLIRIEDTGIGIPDEALQYIFEDFNRVRDQQVYYEGTGLGLAISRQLVEFQDGKIWAESKLGIGSTFFVELPVGIAGALNRDSEQQEFLQKAGAAFHGVILLVEDHQMNQLVARKTLERQWPSATILLAENGQVCLEMIERYHVDIILMDLQMPVMDGYEATMQIRRHENMRIRNVPILAMTANAFVSRDEQLNQKGFSDFVLKPFEPNHLFEQILRYAPLKSIAI